MKEVLFNRSKNNKFNFINFSFLIVLILVVSSWVFIFEFEDANIYDLFSDKNVYHTKRFIGALLGTGEKDVAFADISHWKNAIRLSFETLKMSIMAIGFSTIGMFLTVIPAARTSVDGTLTLSKKWYRWIIFSIIRSLYIFSRAIPELIWAMIIVFILKPGILPGAIALSLHNFGILGKLCAEVIEDLDLRPIRNLSSCGANKTQLLLYGILPTVMPKFITFILYRWEVIIRTTIVVGFIGAGGLGQAFKLSMSWFHYSNVTLILICYLILIFFVDLLCEGLRRF